MEQNKIRELIGMPLFAGVTEAELTGMLGCLGSYTREYKKGEYLFPDRETVPSVGMVISGSIQMLQEDIWGGRTILAVSGKGELFGESFVCADVPKSKMLCYAPMDCEILFLPFRRVIHTCSHACVYHHGLIERMMVMLADKNVKLMEKIEVTSKKTLREKILTYLSILSQQTDSRMLESPMSRAEMAEYLCADRSALSRELASMKKEGLIDYDRNTFRLLQFEN